MIKSMIFVEVLINAPRPNYTEEVKAVQAKIVKYFGTRNATADEESPGVIIDGDLSQKDMEVLKEQLPAYIKLFAIKGSAKSVKFVNNEDIIDLTV